MLWRFASLSLLFLVQSVTPLSAAGILVLGDSWARPIVTPLQQILNENAHSDITVEYSDMVLWAQDFSTSATRNAISAWLNDHPETNIVQLTIGSNDWEWGDRGEPGSYWLPSWAGTQKEIDMCQSIADWIEIGVDHILALRPGMQVVWTGYDFFRPLSTGTPAQRNATLIMLAEIARNVAQSKPGLTYVDTNGLMQVTYGFDGIKYSQYDPDTPIPAGDPSLPDADLPSPIQSFREGDAEHLTEGGFRALAQEQYNQAYRGLLDGETFQINPGLNDAWYNPATNGQGFLTAVFPEIKQIFLAWFTYDTERPPGDVAAMLGEPGHRWLTAQGPYEGDTANLTIFVTEGGIFDSAQPAANTNPSGDGTMTVEFADCTEGLISYEITSLGISGEIPIQRIVLDNISLCESFSAE